MRAGVLQRHRTLGRIASIAVVMCAGVFAHSAFADEARHEKSQHRAATPALQQLCVGPGPNAECEAAFAAALKSADETPELVVSATSMAPDYRLRGAKPLRWQKKAAWVRKIETISKEGIAFVRMPQGPESELVIGINRKGMLGFQLKQRPAR